MTLMTTGLIAFVYVADNRLHEISTTIPGTQSTETWWYFFMEIAAVGVGVVLPALYYHFGFGKRKMTRTKLGKLSRSPEPSDASDNETPRLEAMTSLEEQRK